MFQSTRPRGARLAPRNLLIAWQLFQSTRPRGARLHTNWYRVERGVFQSTRPRGARPLELPIVFLDPLVSIHAPAGGATLIQMVLIQRLISFNPRARGGRDL